jgi:hypothetical protein
MRSSEVCEQVLPAVRAFKPDLLMISAGFDAHEMDPLGQLRMTTEGFGRLTKSLSISRMKVCRARRARDRRRLRPEGVVGFSQGRDRRLPLSPVEASASS